MQKSFSRYKIGDIVVLKLIYSSYDFYKLRPALVLGDVSKKDIIVCKISSKSQIKEYEVKIDQNSLKEGKIKIKSFAHVHSIYTVEKRLIHKKIGELTQSKIKEIKEKLNNLFSITSSSPHFP